MYIELVQRINFILESPQLDKELVEKVNAIISQLNTSEQLGIHSDLSNTALQAVYNYRNELIFVEGAKEHIVWLYFLRKMVENTSDIIGNALFNEIITEYLRVRYIALESIIIELIRQEKLSQAQVERTKQIFQSKAFNKHFTSFKAKTLLKNGLCLNEEIVQELLAVKAYEVLELAIETNALTKDTYVLFGCPIQGEANRKAKQRLFDKIQILKAK